MIDTALSQDYIDMGTDVCNRMITLGGYRLAYLTEYIYSNPQNKEGNHHGLISLTHEP